MSRADELEYLRKNAEGTLTTQDIHDEFARLAAEYAQAIDALATKVLYGGG